MIDNIWNPYLMDDGTFGRNYLGSSLQRKNDRKRKQLAKQQRSKRKH